MSIDDFIIFFIILFDILALFSPESIAIFAGGCSSARAPSPSPEGGGQVPEARGVVEGERYEIRLSPPHFHQTTHYNHSASQLFRDSRCTLRQQHQSRDDPVHSPIHEQHSDTIAHRGTAAVAPTTHTAPLYVSTGRVTAAIPQI